MGKGPWFQGFQGCSKWEAISALELNVIMLNKVVIYVNAPSILLNLEGGPEH